MSDEKRALITGISGQDGAYLARLLIADGYEVHGIVRRSSTIAGLWRIAEIVDDITLHYGDILEGGRMCEIVAHVKPDEVYHLAAQSHVAVSFDQSAYTVDSITVGTANMLNAVEVFGPGHVRYYQASSSEMFGDSPAPQKEDTPFRPRSPYACAKVAAYWMVRNYREAYGLHASNGILFNHESPLRGEEFVTRKITRAVARIKLGLQDKLHLGNIDTQRDFGYAGDYVKAMHAMLQQPSPGDYVIATGETYSIREFLNRAFSCVALFWKDHTICDDKRYTRPLDVPVLRGDAAKARKILKWKPAVKFEGLVEMMVEADLASAKRDELK